MQFKERTKRLYVCVLVFEGEGKKNRSCARLETDRNILWRDDFFEAVKTKLVSSAGRR